MTKNHEFGRRPFLTGLALSGVAAAGCSVRPVAAAAQVSAQGLRQAGIDRPAAAQRHAVVMVADVQDKPAPLLAGLGDHILGLTSGQDPLLAGLAPADLTVTVGVGPALARDRVTDLPVFAREQIAAEHRGGDLMVQVCATDPMVTARAADALLSRLGRSVRPRWSQAGFQGPAPDGIGRNILGFPDGIVEPKDPAHDVWHADGHTTIAVVRRLRIDVDRFLSQPVAAQEAVIGRRRANGAPLSGGGPHASADLEAKTADGRWLIPADAHIRRANALATGSGVMLRRSYNYDNGPGDRGLLFVSFQRDLRTFTATQYRMDEADRLMRYTTATAGGAFLILPGWSRTAPLGAGIV